VDSVLNFNSFNTTESNPILAGLVCEHCLAKIDNERTPYQPGLAHCDSCTCTERLNQIVNAIKEVSYIHEKHNEANELPVSHQVRSDVVDALMMCYNFARNLNKAALPAHEWLESLGRASQKIATKMQPSDDVAVNASLHSAELNIANKQEVINRLNEEVSRCREEIGRLRNLLRSQAGVSCCISLLERQVIESSHCHCLFSASAWSIFR